MTDNGPTRSTRFPASVDEDFQTYRDVNDMSNSEALRRLVSQGLEESKAHPLDDRPDTALAGLLWDARRDVHTFVLIGVMAAVGSTIATGVLASLFSAIAVGYALTVVVGAIDYLVLDRKVTLKLAGYGADGERGDEVAQ